MASHIPFVNEKDCDYLNKYYSDSEMIRVTLESVSEIKARLRKKLPLWLDPGVDGYHWLLSGKDARKGWEKCCEQFQHNNILSNPSFLNRPDNKKVRIFVKNVLDKCYEFRPDWITVPQLPLVEDKNRRKINRVLAKETYEWKSTSQFRGKFILPIIITARNQLKGRKEWKPELNAAKTCYGNAGADGVWAVDSDLNDQMGYSTYEKRFSQLVEFHRDLKEIFPKETRIIAGPYWGMNLVLWARQLCDYPAICLGTSYKYHISGGIPYRSSNIRIAIPPLRRWAVATPELKGWLNRATSNLAPSDNVYKQLQYLKNNYDIITSDIEIARERIARFYKEWFDKIQAVPKAGRALALYQDLSSAYVLGSQLEEFNKSEPYGRAPGKIARQFMLNCL
jgi:hypothetical protein